ncbi:MAG TPA: hypothetical protein VLL52_03235 [Anaerolineae bacterium]|nr:hypothetical protein [Anaerolineae bacterium]
MMRRSYIGLGLFSLVLAGLAVFLVWPRFDGLYGQDPFGYYLYARDELGGALAAGKRFPPFFWPPGYPLLLWVGSLLSGWTPRIGQVINLGAGLAVGWGTVWLAGEVTREEERPFVWLAGMFVLCTGQLWQSAVVVMADLVGLAGATLGVAAVVHWWQLTAGETGERRYYHGWLWLGAGLLAYGILSRWGQGLAAVAVAVPVWGRLIWLGWRGRGREMLGVAVVAALVVITVLSPMWWGWLVGDVVSVGRQAEGPIFAGNFGVYRWQLNHAWQSSFVTTDGLLQYRWPNGIYYLLAPAHRYYFTVWFVLLLPVGLWRCGRRGRGLHWVVVVWAGLVYLFHIGAAWQNFRFTLAYLPPLAILAMWGVIELKKWVPIRFLVGYLLVGWTMMMMGGWELTQFFVERKAAELATVTWVEEQMTGDDLLLTFNVTPTFRFYGQREYADLYYLTVADMEQLVADHDTVWVLIKEEEITVQWADLSPGQNWAWLEAYGVDLVGRDQSYQLWIVTGQSDS